MDLFHGFKGLCHVYPVEFPTHHEVRSESESYGYRKGQQIAQRLYFQRKSHDLDIHQSHDKAVEQLPEQFGAYRRVAAVAAGVLGTTGVESGELTGALCKKLRPDLVIAVDALASRSLARVCTTVQIADTGITPGSGVGNARAALNEETLGVPVLAIGVPTVVDGATLAADIVEEAGKGTLEPEALRGHDGGVFVTPRDIDERVADLSKVIGYAITLALQPHLTSEDAEMLLS